MSTEAFGMFDDPRVKACKEPYSLPTHMQRRLAMFEDALTSGAEAVQLYRQQYEIKPGPESREEFVASLYTHSSLLRIRKDWKAALAYEVEAVSLLDITGQIVRLDTAIGCGAYGTVFEAQWLEPKPMRWDPEPRKEKVVVKVFHVDQLGIAPDSVSRRRMMREMSVWFGLTFARHSNIVGSFGFITDVPGGFGLVAPYFSNGGVMEYLKNNPSANRSEICADVARGLRHLHVPTYYQTPIIHGDVKPGNVVIHQDGRAALCDLGLARLYRDINKEATEDGGTCQPTPHSTSTGFTTATFGGTLRYLSPERIFDEASQPTFEGDVYAFACTCAEVLNGEEPFASISGSGKRTIGRILDALEQKDPPYNLAAVTEGFPSFDWLAECWNSEPTERLDMIEICKRMGIS